MARHTFVTGIEVHGYGVLTGVDYFDETIDVPSKSDIRNLISEETGQISHDIDLQNRKLAKAVEQAKAAAKDAAEAKEAVERLVETAQETFREVIVKLLAPHYRFLAQHLGIDLPAELTTVSPPSLSSRDQNSPVPLSVVSPLSARPKKKTIRQAKSVDTEEESSYSPKRKAASASKKPVVKKKPATLKKLAAKKKPADAVTHPRRKGGKPCRKK
jgi:hypothetical protein